jgi:protein-disulfide isomerase
MDKRNFTIPFAVIVAGILIAGALFLNKRDDSSARQTAMADLLKQQAETTSPIPPVSSDDHILGNPQAPIMIIDYSDTECPYCKQFHNTMHKIMNEYGKGGQVAWVYRHFPITDLHSKALKEAEATECAKELGGESAFWAYLDKIYVLTPSNNGLDPSLLPQIAEDTGLDSALFKKCLASGKYIEKIQNSVADAIRGGAEGTPFSIMIFQDNFIPIVPPSYTTIKGMIDEIFAQAALLQAPE